MFEYKPFFLFFFLFFLSKQYWWCVLFCAWYVIGHYIKFREIIYFTEVSDDILCMMSWTLLPAAVKTSRQAENFHKQIAIAKAVLQGMLMK